ncbi:MAG: SDR family oxidoreductase [Deltaproteobacteria bacterium]|nr:SDR family oxidoreductase [Deltaproteobacteria bacterium]
MRLDGKVAFITGAGMGVGRATCLLFAYEGARIVAVDINSEAGEETVHLVKKRGGKAIFVNCDVADEQEVKKAIETGVKAFGKLNILFNNAGVLWRDKDFEVTRTDEATWDKVMAINLKGTVWVCKYGIRELIKQGGGAIVNIGSGTALMGFTVAQDAYTASKGALASLTRSLAVVYAKDRVRANIIHPGPVDTPMQKEWDDETRQAISEWVPLGRLATAEDIACCGLFLASDESAYITGTELIVDGGIMAKGR